MYEFTKAGNMLYNLTLRWTKFICKHRILFYFLSFTWGIIMTLIGLIISFALLITMHKPERYYWIHCFKIKENWGGFSSGTTFVRDTTSIEQVSEHEFGHTMQNTLFGPIAIFICFIPSMIRYFIRNKQIKQGKALKPYSSIWFEYSADVCGHLLVEELSKK